MVKSNEGLIQYMEIEGGKPLKGTVKVSGAKNSALPNMAAVILSQDDVVLDNIPNLLDVSTMESLLSNIGVKVKKIGDGRFIFSPSGINSLEAPYELVNRMRASILVLGPLLARFGYAKVSLPGGCAIGSRPVDFHIQALKEMGADIKVEHGYIVASAPKGLKGAYIKFPKITVTGTENILMAAVLSKGKTIIDNAAREPEVVNLAQMLKKMGAIIEGEGTSRIVVEGVKELKGTAHSIIPDRIEAGTFAVLSALFGGSIVIQNYPFEYLSFVNETFRQIGVDIIPIGQSDAMVKVDDKLKPIDIETKEYPYFPTDLQAQFMTLLSVVEGVSKITENIFENRFMHVPELKRLGADITIQGKTAVIRGVKKLTGAKVQATDLRASASMVLAGLIAEGTTRVYDTSHLDRGYENIDAKLQLLGAKVKRGFEEV